MTHNRSREHGLPHGRERNAARSKKRNAQDIIGVIVNGQAGFSKSNRRIADAILHEPHRFVEMPIEELTGWLNVSAPTITRFARTVGCDGLKELKLKIMGSVRVVINYLEPATPPNSITEVADRVSNRAQKTIADVRNNIDLDRAEAIIARINRCQTIYAFGGGGVSSWLIEEIQNRFFRLGIRVVPCCDHQMQLMLASTLDRNDVVMCCSLTGANTMLERTLSIAREYGATTIALAPDGTSLATMVDEFLPINAAHDDDILSPAPARYAFLIAIDIISYGVAIARSDAGREKLRRVKQQLALTRATDAIQPLCD